MTRVSHCTVCPGCPCVSTTVAAPQQHSLCIEEEEAAGLAFSPVERRQQRMLHEAIAPYLCVTALRQLAAKGGNLQDALRSGERVPEDIQAILSLLHALLTPRPDERIEKPADIAALLMLTMGYLDHEEFCVVCLDMKNHVQCIHRLYKGTVNAALVRTSEVFREPIRLNSTSIILAHNHPGSTTDISDEDITTTRQIVLAGQVLEIEVLDHLIIAQGVWVSLREQRLGGW